MQEESDLGTQRRGKGLGHVGREVGFEIPVPDSVAFMSCEPLSPAWGDKLRGLESHAQGPTARVWQSGDSLPGVWPWAPSDSPVGEVWSEAFGR